MATFPVPCARCGEFQARFEAEGFKVLGCNSAPGQLGMCVLEFERGDGSRAERLASASSPPSAAPAGAPTTAASPNGAPASAGPSTAGLNASPGPAAAMARRHVNVRALNLRSTPSVSLASNVLRTLSLGQVVEIVGELQDGWWPVRLADGEQGFVKARVDESNGVGTPSLRTPVEAAREALITEAVKQWQRFALGQGKETVDPFFKMVGEMWAALGLPHDGLDDIPWSAAAISFMVRQAAAEHPGYRTFKFAASHSKYIHDAIIKAGQAGAPFHGVRLFEQKPQLGDLVARSREEPVTFDQAGASDAFKSHTDVVVAVHAEAVYAIGGNVSNSVSVTRYAKTDSGHLSDAGGVFALLVNKA